MWRDYFKLGTIVGLDVKAVRVPDDSGRIRVYQGYQEDIPLLDRIASEVAPAGYDIIIDDGSHRGDMTRISFDHLFYRHLKPGGIYVIEDWHTGYLSKWPDGSAYVPQADILETTEVGEPKHRLPSHDYGMVGFVKQLLDRYETFGRIIIAGKRVFVFKNAGSSGPVTPL